MYTLFLEQSGECIMTHRCADKSGAMDVVRQYQKTVCPSKNYMRMWNVEKNGGTSTCIDFGSWSEFFFLSPAINFAEEYNS